MAAFSFLVRQAARLSSKNPFSLAAPSRLGTKSVMPLHQTHAKLLCSMLPSQREVSQLPRGFFARRISTSTSAAVNSETSKPVVATTLGLLESLPHPELISNRSSDLTPEQLTQVVNSLVSLDVFSNAHITPSRDLLDCCRLVLRLVARNHELDADFSLTEKIMTKVHSWYGVAPPVLFETLFQRVFSIEQLNALVADYFRSDSQFDSPVSSTASLRRKPGKVKPQIMAALSSPPSNETLARFPECLLDERASLLEDFINSFLRLTKGLDASSQRNIFPQFLENIDRLIVHGCYLKATTSLSVFLRLFETKNFPHLSWFHSSTRRVCEYTQLIPLAVYSELFSLASLDSESLRPKFISQLWADFQNAEFLSGSASSVSNEIPAFVEAREVQKAVLQAFCLRNMSLGVSSVASSMFIRNPKLMAGLGPEVFKIVWAALFNGPLSLPRPSRAQIAFALSALTQVELDGPIVAELLSPITSLPRLSLLNRILTESFAVLIQKGEYSKEMAFSIALKQEILHVMIRIAKAEAEANPSYHASLLPIPNTSRFLSGLSFVSVESSNNDNDNKNSPLHQDNYNNNNNNKNNNKNGNSSSKGGKNKNNPFGLKHHSSPGETKVDLFVKTRFPTQEYLLTARHAQQLHHFHLINHGSGYLRIDSNQQHTFYSPEDVLSMLHGDPSPHSCRKIGCLVHKGFF